VRGLTIKRLVEEGDLSLTETVIDAAKELEKLGVKAISSDCGYMIRFQKQVAEKLSIPVIMSSLIQLPMLERTIGPGQKIGVICAIHKRLTPDLLEAAGVKDKSNIVIIGMEEKPYFRAPMVDEKDTLDSDKIEKEVVEKATELVASSPEISSILLECSNLPPYAHAVQKATGRPVFDFTTLINLFYQASFRKPFEGFY